MRRVVAFGVFDGIHPGHEAFLREAKSLGDYLVIIIPQDHVVQMLKGHPPKFTIEERKKKLREIKVVDEVIVGDTQIGKWEVLREMKPDIVAVGYDQSALKEDLERHLPCFEFKPEIRILKPHKPEEFHSSVLNYES